MVKKVVEEQADPIKEENKEEVEEKPEDIKEAKEITVQNVDKHELNECKKHLLLLKRP